MLVAISACHGRHALTRLWGAHTLSLGLDGIVVAYTKGQTETRHALCQTAFTLIPMANDPLAGKFNAAMEVAIGLGATRIMLIPSDDFVSQEWTDIARTSTDPYIIPHACAVYNPATDEAYQIYKFSAGTLRFGAGRVVSREAVDKVGELWTPTLNKGLDTASHHRLLATGIHHKIVQTSTVPITDVKTCENLWPYSTWKMGSRDITGDQALHMVSPDIREQLRAIR